MGLMFTAETEMEADGRWIAEVMEIPGAQLYGVASEDAIAKVQALALRVLAKRQESEEESPILLSVSFQAA